MHIFNLFKIKNKQKDHLKRELFFLLSFFFIYPNIVLAVQTQIEKKNTDSIHYTKNKLEKETNDTIANKKKKEYSMKKNLSLINLKVEKYSLKNGMTVLLHQDRRIPQIYHQILVKVGSRDEEEGKTGLAHLFEHMMFRGTNNYTGEEYEEKLESIGARNNAFTSRDYTGYEVTLPKNKLEMVLELEAERLNSLQLTQSHLDKEVEVVKEERRMRTDNNPNEIFEPILNLVFKTHSYGRPILGSMKDLEDMTLKDCKKFYQSYYAPNNSILTLVGDFEIKTAKKWIQKYYGALQSSNIKPSPPYKETPQKKARSIKLKRAVHAPTLAFAYRGPKSGEEGVYSLEVLSRILTSGESSRLHQLLVYKLKQALSVGGFYYDLKEEGIFMVFIMMSPKGNIQKVKELYLSEMNKILSNEVSKTELLKSKRSIMNGYISAVKSLSGKANSLSVNEAYFGDYRELFKDLDRYEKVTAQSIKTQANLYIAPEKMSTVELLPN